MNNYVVAFDTANEMISLGIGLLDRAKKTIECVASREVGAFRASNVKLLPEIDALLADAGISRGEVACVVCGRGPGSFTGVRICLASAKGVAIGLGVPLFGVSTSDAQAWQQWANGARGSVVVLGDAMRKEVYPVRYHVTDSGIERLNSDTVMKAAALPEWLGSGSDQRIVGDALKKYSDLCEDCGSVAGEEERYPTGAGLLLARRARSNLMMAHWATLVRFFPCTHAFPMPKSMSVSNLPSRMPKPTPLRRRTLSRACRADR